MGRGLRQYPVADLLAEIHYHIKERGIRHFEVLDDDFFGYQSSSEPVITLLKEMVKLNETYGISWAAGNGFIAASLSEELLDLMRDSGCVGFRIGIESGNQQMLRRMRKPVSLPLLKKVGIMLQKFPDLFVGGNYIIGLFGEESFREMLDTFRFACEMNLDWAAFTTFQFTSKATAVKENLKLKETQATDFIPAKDTASREITESEKIVSGPEVFNMPGDTIPSPEQIRQIWFTFNLVSNYINNKNLKSGGRPEKFVSWIEAVHIAYPDNPYMPLFAGIGHALLDNRETANRCLEKAKQCVKASRYWNNRFKLFGLTTFLTDFPQDAQEAQQLLEPMRKRYSEWIGQ